MAKEIKLTIGKPELHYQGIGEPEIADPALKPPPGINVTVGEPEFHATVTDEAVQTEHDRSVLDRWLRLIEAKRRNNTPEPYITGTAHLLRQGIKNLYHGGNFTDTAEELGKKQDKARWRKRQLAKY